LVTDNTLIQQLNRLFLRTSTSLFISQQHCRLVIRHCFSTASDQKEVITLLDTLCTFLEELTTLIDQKP